METHRLECDGAQDLVFSGELIGEGELRTDMSGRPSAANYVHGELVRIYRTKAGGLVTMIHRWINPLIPHRASDVHLAAGHDSCFAARQWLVDAAGNGQLDVASKKAWTQSSLACPACAEIESEVDQ